MFLQFGFVIFWQKDFGTKAAHKMLVKLTPGGRKWQLIFPNYLLGSLEIFQLGVVVLFRPRKDIKYPVGYLLTWQTGKSTHTSRT
jgi:hypothetical protein